MKIAEIGNMIEFKGGVRGIVVKVYENSVIVELIKGTQTDDFPFDRTVVNHKNYTIVNKTNKAV